MIHPSLLVAVFSAWALTCVIAGVGYVRRAPAVSFALLGSVLGAVAGLLGANADGPAEVPLYTAVGASVGVVSCGLIGVLTTSASPPSRSFRRAAVQVVIAAPFVAAALTPLLRLACPLYVSGINTGFCNYQEVDQLGGWVTVVVVAFVFDAMFVAGLLLVCERQARRSGTMRSESQVT